MRKLSTHEQTENLPIRKGRATLLRTNLLLLDVGEVLEMTKDEWKAKNGPYYVVAGIKKSHGFQYEYGQKADGTGWLFKRVK